QCRTPRCALSFPSPPLFRSVDQVARILALHGATVHFIVGHSLAPCPIAPSAPTLPGQVNPTRVAAANGQRRPFGSSKRAGSADRRGGGAIVFEVVSHRGLDLGPGSQE